VYKPRIGTKTLMLLMRLLKKRVIVDILERNERARIRSYFNQLELFESENLQTFVKQLFAIEKSHIHVLEYIEGKPHSPFKGSVWHVGEYFVRDIVFGMNDGLLSTFSLIAGLFGTNISSNAVTLAGTAGAIAGTISMAAGAYVSTKAERETMEQQLAIEQRELEIMPETETNELQLLFQKKGVEREQAKDVARKIMSDKDVALETMAREELGFAPHRMVSPYGAAVRTGIAFTIGAAVPIVPFLVVRDIHLAFPIAIVGSLSGFFIIGAGRTIVTGKKVVRSGLEMFMIGTAAALITYAIGVGIGSLIMVN